MATSVSSRIGDPAPAGDPPKVAVIGMGNLLLKDEGVGIHVIQALEKTSLEGCGEFMIVDGGTCSDILLQLPEGIEKLIIVDAVKGGGEPGSVYRFAPGDIAFERGTQTSVHQLGLAESLEMMAAARAEAPQVVILGVEPKEVDWGLEISAELQERVPLMIALVKEELKNQR